MTSMLRAGSTLRHLTTAAALLALGACEPGMVARPDAGTSPGGDGGPHGGDGAGIALQFRGAPAIPGKAGGAWDADIDTAKLKLERLRVVGDSTSPGDPRTSLSSLELTFASDQTFTFDTAPPGVYSLIVADVAEIEIEGRVKVQGNWDYKITDSSPGVTIELAVPALQVDPNMEETIAIRVDVGDLVRDLPWDELVSKAPGGPGGPGGPGDGDDDDDDDDRKLVTIDSSSSEIALVRQALMSAFQLE